MARPTRRRRGATHRIWGSVAGIALCAGSIGAGSAAADAPVRLGPDLTPAQDGTAFGCGEGMRCSDVSFHSTNPAVPTTAPFNGVVTRWRFRAACCIPEQAKDRAITLRVFKPGPSDGSYGYQWPQAVRTGPSYVIPAGNVLDGEAPVDLPARLPIAKGESVGLDIDGPIEMATYNFPNAFLAITTPALLDGQETNAYGVAGAALAMNADIEPDADGDGFGDVTQDCSPDDPAVSGGCAPPPSRPPPSPSIVGKIGPCEHNCGGGGVSFGGLPQLPQGGDPDAIVIEVSCPLETNGICTGILVAHLPGAGGNPRIALADRPASKPALLGKLRYSIAPGKTKKLKLKLSHRGRQLLATRRGRRRVVLTLEPDGGAPVSKTVTLSTSK